MTLFFIFHEAHLFGGPFFGVFPLFPKWRCYTNLVLHWLCRNLTDRMLILIRWDCFKHSYIPALKKSNKNRLLFARNRLPHKTFSVNYQDLGSIFRWHWETTTLPPLFCRAEAHHETKLQTSPSWSRWLLETKSLLRWHMIQVGFHRVSLQRVYWKSRV